MCQYPGVDEKVPRTDLHGWDHNHRAGQVILAAVVAVTEKVRVESVVQVVCLLHGLVFLKQSVVVFAFLGIHINSICYLLQELSLPLLSTLAIPILGGTRAPLLSCKVLEVSWSSPSVSYPPVFQLCQDSPSAPFFFSSSAEGIFGEGRLM